MTIGELRIELREELFLGSQEGGGKIDPKWHITLESTKQARGIQLLLSQHGLLIHQDDVDSPYRQQFEQAVQLVDLLGIMQPPPSSQLS